MASITGKPEIFENLRDSHTDASEKAAFCNFFPEPFMKKYTEFDSIENFLEKLGVTSCEEIEAMPERKLNDFVQAHTEFKTWGQMQNSAFDKYLKK